MVDSNASATKSTLDSKMESANSKILAKAFLVENSEIASWMKIILPDANSISLLITKKLKI